MPDNAWSRCEGNAPVQGSCLTHRLGALLLQPLRRRLCRDAPERLQRLSLPTFDVLPCLQQASMGGGAEEKVCVLF